MGTDGRSGSDRHAPRRGAALLALGLALAVGLGACAEDDTPPPLSFLYISNPDSTNLLARKVRKGSGNLLGAKGQPYDTQNPLEGLAAHPNGQVLYAVSGEGDSVSTYAIDTKDGELTFLDGINAATGSYPVDVAVTPDGSYLYTVDELSATVTGYEIAADGTLTALGGASPATGTGPAALAIDPDGNFLFVANETAGTVSVFDIAADGSLTVSSTPAVGNGPAALALSSDGALLFVANQDDDTLGVFTVDGAGNLTAGTDHPTSVEDEPRGVTVHPTADVVYVVNREPAFAEGSVSAFAFTAGGALTEVSGQPFLAGTKPRSLIFEPAEGEFAYVLNRDGGDISGFTASATTGALTELNKSPYEAGQSPRAAAAVPRVK